MVRLPGYAVTARTHLPIKLCARDQVFLRCRHRIGATRGVARYRSAESGAKQNRLQPARSNIGPDRQDAKFGRGDQNNGGNAVGRYCSEYKNFDGPRTHYSITVSVPDMSSWPSPQKTSQKNVNLPAWSGTNRTFSTAPGVMSARR